VLDASLQAPLGGRLTLKLDAKNLLDAPYRVTQGSVIRHRYTAGRGFSAGLSWQP
jgi:outer membrane receptor protein involved in Fe transport